MKLIPAVSLAVSLARVTGTPAVQVPPVYAPPPPSGYYGDYGPPLRYVLALSGRSSLWIAPDGLRARRLSNQAPAQQAGIQQPLDRRPARLDLLECRHEQSRIVRNSGSDTHRHRQVGAHLGFHRLRQ